MLALFFNRVSTFYFLFFSHFFEIFLIFIPWLIIWCFFHDGIFKGLCYHKPCIDLKPYFQC